jgi:hypothetical protein
VTGVEIVIDELIVRGLSAEEARSAAIAFETRLGTLASAGTVRAREEAFRELPAIDVPAGDPARIGEAVAGAVWSAVAKEERP